MKIFKGKIKNPDLEKLNMTFSKDNGTLIGTKYFIWGVRSKDDIMSCETNFYTMNDIDLTYDKKTNLFELGIETAYGFRSVMERNNYLFNLLKKFENFMKSKGFIIDECYNFWFSDCTIPLASSSLPQLLAQFRVFVKGIMIEEITL